MISLMGQKCLINAKINRSQNKLFDLPIFLAKMILFVIFMEYRSQTMLSKINAIRNCLFSTDYLIVPQRVRELKLLLILAKYEQVYWKE